MLAGRGARLHTAFTDLARAASLAPAPAHLLHAAQGALLWAAAEPNGNQLVAAAMKGLGLDPVGSPVPSALLDTAGVLDEGGLLEFLHHHSDDLLPLASLLGRDLGEDLQAAGGPGGLPLCPRLHPVAYWYRGLVSTEHCRSPGCAPGSPSPRSPRPIPLP